MSGRNVDIKISRARKLIVSVLAIVVMSMSIPEIISGQTPKSENVTTRAAKNSRSRTPVSRPASSGSSSSKSDSTKPLPKFEPQIPKANRFNKERVFLEKADMMYKTEIDTFIIVSGNVEFSHGHTLMYCDSAHFFPGSESLNAFGNVRMRQGDTLFIYADELNYSGTNHIAYLYGDGVDSVRMINRDVTLKTPTFIYDLGSEFGYYNEGGSLTDKQNRLTSREGEYIPATKDANFYNNVVLRNRSDNDTLLIFTDTLFYNTATHFAWLESKSTIVNSQATIETTYGTYNTDGGEANLYNRSKVTASTGATLEGDTIFYDRNKGFGEAFGNMVIVDSAHSVILTGDYGYYNEIVDSAFATGNALAKEYSQGDTLYLHGKYLYGYAVYDTIRFEPDTVAYAADSLAIDPIPVDISAYERIDTSYVFIAHPRVRFYRSDVQGICDSMRFEQRDSMLYMHYHPIVWSDERQIHGNIIQLHFNDSTVERAILPDYGFSAEHIEDKYYNQMSGKEMIAYFEGGEMYQLDVNGNVQAIMYPEEKDSTINKVVSVESSFLLANFEKREITRAKMWPETSGTVTPLYLAKKSMLYLPQFAWYVDMRPIDPEDVMIVPESMDQLMSDVPPSRIIPRRHIDAETGEIVTDPIAEPQTEDKTETEADSEPLTDDTGENPESHDDPATENTEP